MTYVIAPLVSAYVVIAVLLLDLNLASRWVWPIKAAAIVVTTGFFAASYLGAVSLLGWPSRSPIPPRFQLLSSKLVEPDKRSGSGGGIFLWVDALDENNVPVWHPALVRTPVGFQGRRTRRGRSGQDQVRHGRGGESEKRAGRRAVRGRDAQGVVARRSRPPAGVGRNGHRSLRR